ncbi:hypothetical protein OIU77_024672 [Salix suchowensis]|uniref:Pentatricopeptide repeat-containing protein n=1 Tax=Salix suchowensis TaxID=1278906 RepID=A0ABQ9BTJ4_9ROSI|nr:hypothetical protein OIU77_024672 [Salix suchowensis]
MADALIAYDKIYDAGIVPNRVTVVNALGACAGFRAMEVGVWTHHFLRRNEWELEVIMGTSIDVYLKWGRIDEGLKALRGEKLFWWFNRMEQEGFGADHVTLATVLNACIHSGPVDMGRQVISNAIVMD